MSSVRPSGTVSFLFTDIEGSTRLWDSTPEAMRAALARHDEIVRTAIEAHGGFVFSTGGDGFAAAFHRAADAVAAAIDAQRRLGCEPWPAPAVLRARMGVHTGEAEERGGDYFGPPLNRAARIMAVGHGGQVLLSAATREVIAGFELRDLGEHRLRDLSRVEHLFQVCADGLAVAFPPLRTLEAVPGNLPVQATSFVGRDAEVDVICELVRAQPAVTLTGVGGVGKTRLALQVAATLVTEFRDGAWFVELAPIADGAALPDAVAATIGIAAQDHLTVAESVQRALSGQHLLILLDNCEHVLDAAAEFVGQLLARSRTVKVLATSREALQLPAEHLWQVPPLELTGGAASDAVELFVERARAVDPAFILADDGDVGAVDEICRRLDGNALAIELAAARMVSMTAQDVAERLGDRFRLLSGTSRVLGRHQTLRHAVSWSYDLLDARERFVLEHCSVFADGFDLLAACRVVDAVDEYEALDLLESLVRKSLVNSGRMRRHARYGLLETIRQYADERLAARSGVGTARDRHARYFAEQSIAHWGLWDGPRQRVALDWVEDEFANLRTAFRWSADQGDVTSAAAIAAHTVMLAYLRQRFEPISWAEEILPAAAEADIPQLPRLYSAASLCTTLGRADDAVGYAQTAVALEADPRYDAFAPGWSRLWEAAAHAYAGRVDRWLEISTALLGQPGLPRVLGLCGMLYALPALGRAEEATAIADEAVAEAQAYGNPAHIAYALFGYGRAFADIDPGRARQAARRALAYAREQRMPYWEWMIALQLAGLEALHGEAREGLTLFDRVLERFGRAGQQGTVAITLASLAIFFDRIERPELAAVVYGASSNLASIHLVANLPAAVDRLRSVLGSTAFDAFVAEGAALEPAAAVRFAREQIEGTHRALAASSCV